MATACTKSEISNGRLVLWYEMIQAEMFLKACLNSIGDDIKTQTKLAPWMGTP